MLRRATCQHGGAWSCDKNSNNNNSNKGKGKKGRDTLKAGTVQVTAHVQLQPDMVFSDCRVVFQQPIRIQNKDHLSINNKSVPLVPHAVSVETVWREGHTVVVRILDEGVAMRSVVRQFKLQQELWGGGAFLDTLPVANMRLRDDGLHLHVVKETGNVVDVADAEGEDKDEDRVATLSLGDIPSLAALSKLVCRLTPIALDAHFVCKDKGAKLKANKTLLKRLGCSQSAKPHGVSMHKRGTFALEPLAVVPFGSVYGCDIDGVCSALSDVLNSHRVPCEPLVNGEPLEAKHVERRGYYSVDFSNATWLARFAGEYPEREVRMSDEEIDAMMRIHGVSPFAAEHTFTVDAPDGRLRIRSNRADTPVYHIGIEGAYGLDIAGMDASGCFIGGPHTVYLPRDAVPQSPIKSAVTLRLGDQSVCENLVKLPKVGGPTTVAIPLGALHLSEAVSIAEISVTFEEYHRVPGHKTVVFLEFQQRSATEAGFHRRHRRKRHELEEGSEGILYSDEDSHFGV